MMIKKVTCAVFAAVAVMLCHGLSLNSSEGGGYSAPSNDGTAEGQEGQEEQQEQQDSAYEFTFEDDFPEEVGGYEVLSEFLPDGVGLEWTGKKLKAPKAGKVKYSKKDGDFVDTKESDNPSGLTVKYNKKKGTISGSFKVYVAKSEKKLKTFTAKFSGKLGDSMKVTIKKKVVATAVIE